MTDDLYVVYQHTNSKNGKSYVGITPKAPRQGVSAEDLLQRRWKEHCKSSSTRSMLYFHKAIRKYGEDCFEHKILEVCHSLEDVLKREIYWIDRLHTTVDENGYNMTKGGEGNLMPEAVKERHKLATSTGTRQAFLRQEVKENHRKAMEAVYKRPGMLASRGKAISAALSDPETKLKMSVASKRAWQNSEKLLNRRKQTQQLTASNEAVALFSSAREAARVTGVAQGNISKCARGEINLAGGFKWRYVENP